MELAESSAARVRIMDFHKKVLSFRSANKQIPRITTLYGPCKMSIHEHRTFFFSPVYTCPFLDSFSPSEAKSIGSPWPMASHPLAYKSKWKLKMVCDKTRTIRTWANNSNCNCSFDRWLNISLVRLLRRSIVRSIERTAVPIREQYKLLFSKVVLTRWAKWKELSKEAE